jgi:alkaline phosphatase D
MQKYADSHFVIGAGDSVFYDTPRQSTATTLPQMRAKWQQQFSLPRLVQFLGSMGSYWMKDDHDFRFDDADRTGPREPSPLSQFGPTGARPMCSVIRDRIA